MGNLRTSIVSCYRNYYTPDNPKPVNLYDWLTSDKYAETVIRIRSIEDKQRKDQLKATLPAITPCGIFSHRKNGGLIQFSGFMQIDIDLKGNEHIINFHQLKSFMSCLPYVAYCGLSVSGKGYWLLIPIAEAEHIKEHFRALASDWKKTAGISLDPARSDLSGLRGYSYDPEAYFNLNASAYTKRILPSSDRKVNFANARPMDKKDVFSFALKSLESKGLHLVDGQKHEFIFRFCCILNSFGIPQREAEAWIDIHLISLNEIRSNCIDDAYNRYQSDFGKLKHLSSAI